MITWYHAVRSMVAVPTWGGLLLLLLRITVIVAAGRLALALSPRASAATRHVILTTTLVALVALPVAMAVVPAWQAPILPRLALRVPSPPQLTTAETFVKSTFDVYDGDPPFGAEPGPQATRLASPAAPVPAAPAAASPVSHPAPARPVPARPWIPSVPLLVALAMLAGAELLLLRLAVSLLAAWRLAPGSATWAATQTINVPVGFGSWG